MGTIFLFNTRKLKPKMTHQLDLADDSLCIIAHDADGNEYMTTMDKLPGNSFSLSTAEAVARQQAKKESPFGATLVPLNLAVGNRTTPVEAPPSKKAKKARANGQEKKVFKVTTGAANNRFGGNYNNGKRFGKECGVTRDNLKKMMETCFLEQKNRE